MTDSSAHFAPPTRSQTLGGFLPWLLLLVVSGYLLWNRMHVPAVDGSPRIEFANAQVLDEDTRPAAPVSDEPLSRPTPADRHETLRPQFPQRDVTSTVPYDLGARRIEPSQPFSADELNTIDTFRKCSASVVFIKTTAVVGLNRFNLNPVEMPVGTGSGIVWDRQGHIVTNFHVVEGSRTQQVILADQSSWDATLVGVAADKDLAVLKIEAPAERLTPILLGTSSDLQVGQRVLAIGNPFGLDQTLTTGIISGLQREIKARTGRRIEGVIQTDAAINPGNSGGPLLDSSGRLIGVNTAIFSPSGAYAGIGFAIPADFVERYVPQIVAYGKVIRPYLGISTAPTSVMRQIGLEGVLVLEVARGGTAEKAGIQPTTVVRDDIRLGDIIVALDEAPIANTNDLLDYLDERQIGEKITITVLRDAGTDSQKTLRLAAPLLGQTFEE